MDPETKSLLMQSIDASRQNNLMLQELVRGQKQAKMYRIVYWVAIIVASLGSFVFIQPYLGNLLNIYTGGAATGLDTPTTTPTPSSTDSTPTNKQQMQDLLNSLQSKN